MITTSALGLFLGVRQKATLSASSERQLFQLSPPQAAPAAGWFHTVRSPEVAGLPRNDKGFPYIRYNPALLAVKHAIDVEEDDVLFLHGNIPVGFRYRHFRKSPWPAFDAAVSPLPCRGHNLSHHLGSMHSS